MLTEFEKEKIELMREFGLRYDPVCICLPGNVKNKENALKWIQSVLK